MITHLNFDVETLGTRPGSVVLSLACVAFKFEDEKTFADYILDGFYVKFDPIEQIKLGRLTDADTLSWWKKQSDEARAVTKPSKDDVSLKTGLAMLRDYIKGSDYEWKHGYCWCRGNYFDFPMLESLHDQAAMPIPYNTWKIRDTRTFFDVLTGGDRGMYELKDGLPKEFVHHHALHDTALDVMRMKEVFRMLSQDD